MSLGQSVLIELLTVAVAEQVVRMSSRASIDRYYLGKFRGYGVFVHHVHDDDPDFFHTHPWDGVAFMFGVYDEERFGEPRRRRRLFNFVSAHHPHRITLPKGPLFTLFIHGPRKSRWSVRSRDGRVVDVEPWRGVGGRASYAPGLENDRENETRSGFGNQGGALKPEARV